MKREEVVQQVNNVLQEGFELEASALKAEAHLYYDLGIDSLDAIDMLVYIEEKLGRTVDATLFKGVRQLQDIYDVVERIVTGEGVAPGAVSEPKPATT